jgi:hypothetical protein
MNDTTQVSTSSPARAELSGVLLESVEEILCEPVTDAEIARSLGRARQLAQPTMLRPSRLRRLLAAAAIAASILAAALFISHVWTSTASVAWADVVAAVAKRPWVHYVEMWSDGTKNEGWYSEGRAVEGSHYTPSGPNHGVEQYVWSDYPRKTRAYYSPATNTIAEGTDREMLTEHKRFFKTAMLSGRLEAPNRLGRYELVDQRQRETTEEGRRCIEYRFRWRDRDLDAQSSTEFVAYVDPDTRLPFRLDLIGASNRNRTPFERYDYPETGPEDIYALGVPKTAQIVDCTLPLEVERLAAATVAESRRDDIQFSALVVRSSQGWHSGYRVWKKGACWRVDSSVGSLARRREPSPAAEVDAARWWRAKAEKAMFAPQAIFDGKSLWEYRRETRHPNQAEIAAGADKDAVILVSNEKKKQLPWLAEQNWGSNPLRVMGHPGNLDDFPPRGLPIQSAPPWLATLDHNPKSGPSDCEMLELRNPLWKLDDSGVRLWTFPQVVRVWIDPKRDHLVMRSDSLITQDGREKCIGKFELEGLTQDPKDRWFPTVVRELVHYLPPDGQKDLDEATTRFYYGFDTAVPDSLFEAK